LWIESQSSLIIAVVVFGAYREATPN